MTTNVPAPIGTIAAGLPKPIEFNSGEIAADLQRYADEADKAVAVVNRAVIDDQDSFDRGADLAKSIRVTLASVEDSRRKLTLPLDAAKKRLTSLFATPADKLEMALSAIKRKMDAFRRAEEQRRREAAEAARRAAEEEARKLAEAQAAMGDAEGAQQIIEEAAALPVVSEKVTATGVYGGSAGSRKRAVGEITNKIDFVRWALENSLTTISEAEFKASVLNALARGILEGGENPQIPGFSYRYEESLTIR